MAEQDTFITDCEKTLQILHATFKQQVVLPTTTNHGSITKNSPFMASSPKTKIAVTKKKKKSSRYPKTATSKFYKISNASTKRIKYHTKDNDQTPPLKSSVLRKMYRCDDSILLAKLNRASRMQAKLEHLQQVHQHRDKGLDDATSNFDSSDDDDVDHDDEKNTSHVIHDIVERLVANENQLSLQRARQLTVSTYMPNVKQIWDEMVRRGEGKTGKKNDEREVDKEEAEVTNHELETNKSAAEHEFAEATKVTDTSIEISCSTSTVCVTEAEIPTVETTDLSLSTRRLLSYTATNTDKVFLGSKVLGRSGIWRLNSTPINETESESTLFQWPSPSEIKYPEHLDTSQAFSYFYSEPNGREGEACVKVLHRFAFKSPILAPYCYATSKGFIVPPFSQPECVSGPIPHTTFPGTSLMNTQISSRLDAFLRQPIVVVDPAASSKDHTYSPNSLNEFDDNGFRRMTFADALPYDGTISTRAFGIRSAFPNKPAVLPPITHTSDECCIEYLSRERTANDYHYIAESDGEGTHNEPYLFVSHMSGYHPRHVSKMSITEQKRLVHAAKESESRKFNELSTTLRLKGAEKLTKERFTQRIAKIKDSVESDIKMIGNFQPQTTGPLTLSPNALQTIESQTNNEQHQRINLNTPRVPHNPIGKRNVERGKNEPKVKKLDENRKLATSRATPNSYESHFATKTQSLFIQDLTTERLKLSRSRGNQKKTEDSILSSYQSQYLDEILQVPVLATGLTASNTEEVSQNRNDSMDPVTKAIMAVKNHNLPALEEVLDGEGDLDIDTRDQHGNTLFILACQQGSKKLAKFLLRRGSYINAQNHGGNTALHYLNEYNHTNLADWLVRKGADDTLQNAEGCTVYEGLGEAAWSR
jgi:hypothetical protein